MTNTLEDIYHGKRVLVTGHTGFKGGWLSLWLHMLGARVTGLALSPEGPPSLFDAVGLQDFIDHRIGDIRNAEALFALFREIRPEVVFHLAAQPLVRRSYEHPRLTYETNIMGVVNVLEAVRLSDHVDVLVNITSDKCYHNREWMWGYREVERMGGDDPYSSSKGCAELITHAYRKSFFDPGRVPGARVTAVDTARGGNVIGGGDWGEDRLLPDCMRALSRKKPVLIRAPHYIRPWQYILDVLHGYLLLGAELIRNGPHSDPGWNFGPMDHRLWTVAQLAEKACAAWGDGRMVISDTPQPPEAGLLLLDSSKARRYLGWRSAYSTESAIEHAVLWYKRFYSGATVRAMAAATMDHIRDYPDRLA